MRGVGSLYSDRIWYQTVVIDVCLFFRRLLCNVFPFPVCKAQLIGDWYENKGGAPNTSIFLIFLHSYWRTEHEKKLLAYHAWSALPIGGGGHWCCSARDWDRNRITWRNPWSGCSEICASLKGPL
jgi:hypothetical protein